MTIAARLRARRTPVPAPDEPEAGEPGVTPDAPVTLLGLELRGPAGWGMRVVVLPRALVEAHTVRLDEGDVSSLVVERVRSAAHRIVCGAEP